MTVEVSDYWLNFVTNFSRGFFRVFWYVGLIMIAMHYSKRLENRQNAATAKAKAKEGKAVPSGTGTSDS